MNPEDIDKIKQILAGGYRVEIKNPEGATFSERYTVYQLITLRSCAHKEVIFDENGIIIGYKD